ncbi:hypothetical protein F5ESL0233_01840 [Lactobacillus sp. ESL0233]|uniref:hypothetical protein n=1 Tax=Lactobacillus sp. ESL0233 TaxID=2069354 RepID=UPI000EFB99A8|nr:hypothetical protein [Lactobacillus sp. ESL0233]RMC42072.1 hypothetical protein F5ESL0233_01840 [Lactobacillus sp. ESL0233]
MSRSFNYINGSKFESFFGVILICLAVYQLFNSVKYTKGILHKGTNNGFSLGAITFSFFFSLILFVIGILAIMQKF